MKKKIEKSLEARIKELEIKVAILESRQVQYIPYPIYPQNPPPFNPPQPLYWNGTNTPLNGTNPPHYQSKLIK